MNISECIGRTMTVRLTEIERRFGLNCEIYGKAELMNPGGSVKDRVAMAILESERQGKLHRGDKVITATSGNFGIALAMLSAHHGYKAKIVMPSSASEERRRLIKAYGQEVISIDGGMREAIDTAEKMARESGGSYIDQFTNRKGVECHYKGTGRELWVDMQSNIDIFITVVGTGATLSGVGTFLKERKRGIRIIGVEPKESAVLSGYTVGAHSIEGIGAGFVPPLYDATLVDGIEAVSSDEAKEYTREIARCEGIFAGISSGASLAAAVGLCRREELRKKRIAIILCDRGERYFSRGVID